MSYMKKNNHRCCINNHYSFQPGVYWCGKKKCVIPENCNATVKLHKVYWNIKDEYPNFNNKFVTYIKNIFSRN